MGVRIYALAKELKLDSKDLVEICRKAGIAGKGSPLASLDDAEVAKVKSHLAGGSGGSEAPKTEPTKTAAAKAPAPPPSPTATATMMRPVRPNRGVGPTSVREIRDLRQNRSATSRSDSPDDEDEGEQQQPAAAQARPAESPTPAPTPESPPRETLAAETPSTEAPTPSRPAASEEPTKGREPKVQEPKAQEPKAQERPVAPQRPATESQGEAQRPVRPLTGSQQPKQTPPPAAKAPERPTPSRQESQRPETPASRPPAQPQTPSPAAETPSRTNRPLGRVSPLGGKIGQIRDMKTGEATTGRDAGRRPAGGPGAGTGGPNRRPPPSPVHLAPMPEAPKAPPKLNKHEEKAQKPEIALDINQFMQKGRTGASPLSKHVMKELERQHEAKQGETAPRRGGAAAPGTTTEAPGTGSRRRSKGGAAAEKPADDVMLIGREGRQQARQKKKSRRRRSRDDDGPGGGARYTSSRTLQRRRNRVSTAAPRKSDVVVELPITIRALSESLGVPVPKVLKVLLGLQIMANVNTTLEEEDQVNLIISELGVDAEVRAAEDLEDEVIGEIDQYQDDNDDLERRPPVVTFLGHVDHGKTSLLDKIIGVDVAKGESGGITQHIRAYNVPYGESSITFVDTPGHEAFTAMRARGADATDIAVLVVAADDGVMPQTEEALSHARAAEVPIVVAMNKIDVPGANPERVLQQLAERDLLPAEWGGDIEVIRTSALTGEGIDELMETLLTLSDLHELSANPDRAAVGVCLESQMQGSRGVVAKLLVQNGTLRAGDVIICGTAFGRVRTMDNFVKRRTVYEEAGPGIPVDVTGLDEAPAAGQTFYVLNDITQAREIIEARREQARIAAENPVQRGSSLEDFSARLAEMKISMLNLIIRADTRGSLEAIEKELSKLEHPEVQIRILQKLVGGISEADVALADVTDSVILGFNVVPDDRAKSLAREKDVQIRQYGIIYELTDDIRKAMEQRLKPGQQTVELGVALVKQLFVISRIGTIAGCYVTDGKIERNSRIKIVRDGRVIGDYQLDSLRREKDDVREVRQGYECGIKLSGFNDLKDGDMLYSYKIEQVARTLDDI